MQISFQEQINKVTSRQNSSLCLGIDPEIHKLPPVFAKQLEADGIEKFLTRYCEVLLFSAASELCSVKFQSAYFEAFGADGMRALLRGIKMAKGLGYMTILDAKRGDIASTMAAYGRMAFEHFDADSLTVTPYMGTDVLDALVPWLNKGRGVYVVWVTSNASASEFEDAELLNKFKLFEQVFSKVIAFAKNKNVEKNVGFVLGANRVDALPLSLLDELTQWPLLMPGIGAQGAKITPKLKSLLTSKALVPQSRSIGGISPGMNSFDDLGRAVSERVRAAKAELLIG